MIFSSFSRSIVFVRFTSRPPVFKVSLSRPTCCIDPLLTNHCFPACRSKWGFTSKGLCRHITQTTRHHLVQPQRSEWLSGLHGYVGAHGQRNSLQRGTMLIVFTVSQWLPDWGADRRVRLGEVLQWHYITSPVEYTHNVRHCVLLLA